MHRHSNLTRRDAGAYSALATNFFGGALTDTAALRVLVPQRLDVTLPRPANEFQVWSRDADGGLLREEDLGGFAVETSTNAVDWEVLNSVLTVTNGHLLLRDAGVTNRSVRFYRILER